MRLRLVLVLWAGLVGVELAAAQNPDKDWTPPAPMTDAPAPMAVPIEIPLLPGPTPPRYWLSSEFVRWSARTPVPVPIVTTGNTNDGPLAGAISQPDTRVRFGIDDVFFSHLPGMRAALGAWLDPEQNFGMEYSLLYLPRQIAEFRLGNDSAVPGVYLSGFNVVIGREDSGILADLNENFGGSVVVTNIFQLWGTELNGLGALWKSPTCNLHLLAGVRYLHLRESMEIAGFSRDLGIDSRVTSVDQFKTTNHFFGGQVGFRVRWQPSQLGFEATSKFAFGTNQATVDIDGENARFGTALPFSTRSPGGFFTQPSNIGTTTRSDFSFVPSLDLKVDFQCASHTRIYFNYGFIVFNDVVRPGNQIDRNLNLTASPVFGAGGPASDTPSPSPRFRRSPMFADGFSIGVEFKF